MNKIISLSTNQKTEAIENNELKIYWGDGSNTFFEFDAPYIHEPFANHPIYFDEFLEFLGVSDDYIVSELFKTGASIYFENYKRSNSTELNSEQKESCKTLLHNFLKMDTQTQAIFYAFIEYMPAPPSFHLSTMLIEGARYDDYNSSSYSEIEDLALYLGQAFQKTPLYMSGLTDHIITTDEIPERIKTLFLQILYRNYSFPVQTSDFNQIKDELYKVQQSSISEKDKPFFLRYIIQHTDKDSVIDVDYFNAEVNYALKNKDFIYLIEIFTQLGPLTQMDMPLYETHYQNLIAIPSYRDPQRQFISGNVVEEEYNYFQSFVTLIQLGFSQFNSFHEKIPSFLGFVWDQQLSVHNFSKLLAGIYGDPLNKTKPISKQKISLYFSENIPEYKKELGRILNQKLSFDFFKMPFPQNISKEENLELSNYINSFPCKNHEVDLKITIRKASLKFLMAYPQFYEENNNPQLIQDHLTFFQGLGDRNDDSAIKSNLLYIYTKIKPILEKDADLCESEIVSILRHKALSYHSKTTLVASLLESNSNGLGKNGNTLPEILNHLSKGCKPSLSRPTSEKVLDLLKLVLKNLPHSLKCISDSIQTDKVLFKKLFTTVFNFIEVLEKYGPFKNLLDPKIVYTPDRKQMFEILSNFITVGQPHISQNDYSFAKLCFQIIARKIPFNIELLDLMFETYRPQLNKSSFHSQKASALINRLIEEDLEFSIESLVKNTDSHENLKIIMDILLKKVIYPRHFGNRITDTCLVINLSNIFTKLQSLFTDDLPLFLSTFDTLVNESSISLSDSMDLTRYFLDACSSTNNWKPKGLNLALGNFLGYKLKILSLVRNSCNLADTNGIKLGRGSYTVNTDEYGNTPYLSHERKNSALMLYTSLAHLCKDKINNDDVHELFRNRISKNSGFNKDEKNGVLRILEGSSSTENPLISGSDMHLPQTNSNSRKAG
ncbi:hypothetical protein HOG98_05710 [bacterium]|jgi:hypothetical protein|nr:hypothetical protein [bacterium]